MKIAYIAHPIGGDVKGNIEKILEIIREINLHEPTVVPFAPYIGDCLALDDSIKSQRERGIRNNMALLKSGVVNELRVYGNRLSDGVREEIAIAREMKIPVFFKVVFKTYNDNE